MSEGAVAAHETDDRVAIRAVQRGLRAPRAAGVAGIVFSALFIASLALIRLALGRAVGLDSAGEDSAIASADLAVAGLYLMPFAGIAFLWFIAVIRNRLGEREDRFFATVLLGSGLLFVGTLFAGAAAAGGVVAGASLGGGEADSAAITFGRSFAYALFFVYATKAAGVFVITTSTIVRVLPGWPRWLALLGYAVGLVLLLSVTYYEPILLLFPMWVAIVSVYVLLTERTRAATR
jgi:hypothetical protein